MKRVVIYTDGACSGNPGVGGWGAVLIYGEAKKEISGAEKMTTNNRMELTAAIKALELLREPCEVELYTDSAYLCNGFNNGWIWNWLKNGWKTASGKPVENRELWERLLELQRVHKLRSNCAHCSKICRRFARSFSAASNRQQAFSHGTDMLLT